MRLSLLLFLLPLISGTHALTPKTGDSVAASKQSELENGIAPLTQIVTFPNMVKTTKLSQPNPAELSKIETLLKSESIDFDNLDTGEDFQTPKLAVRGLFMAQFITKPSRKMSATQVKIPATGSFQLKLTEGPVFKIVDKDATDGSALIQMPAATLNTWLKLSQNWSQNSSLEIEEPLYYLKDIVSAQKQNVVGDQTLFTIGLRPLPVPDEWRSPYGKDLVLNFTIKDASSFQMIWVRNDEKPSETPLGIKEIGPEGGTVELPGVGKLEIPAGALDMKKTIRMIQLSQAKIPSELTSYLKVVSPIVGFYPNNLELKESAFLKLEYDSSRFIEYGDASLVSYISKGHSESDQDWFFQPRVIDVGNDSIFNISYLFQTSLESLSTTLVVADEAILKK